MRHHKTFKQAERQNIPGRAEESGCVDKPGIKEPQNSLGMPSLAQVTQLSTWQHPGHISAEHCKFNVAFPSVPGRRAPGNMPCWYRCSPPSTHPELTTQPSSAPHPTAGTQGAAGAAQPARAACGRGAPA